MSEAVNDFLHGVKRTQDQSVLDRRGRIIEEVKTSAGRERALEMAFKLNPTPNYRDGGATAKAWEDECRWVTPRELCEILIALFPSRELAKVDAGGRKA